MEAASFCSQLTQVQGADPLKAHLVCCDGNVTATTTSSSPAASSPPSAHITASDPDPRSGISANGCIPPSAGVFDPGKAIGIFAAPTSAIPSEFFSAPNLNKLTVYNTLQGTVDLSRATTLTYLKLYLNDIAQLINGEYSASRNLRFLIAPKNGLSGEFPPNILEKGFLQVLNLTQNRFEGALPPDLAQKLPMITTLDLSYNRFKGAFPNLADMRDLEYLDVSNNDFSEIQPTLPTKLRTLRIGDNPNASGGFSIRPTEHLQDVHVSGNPALLVSFQPGQYALKRLTATLGVKVNFHPNAYVASGSSFECAVDLDQACILDTWPGTKGASGDAGDVDPSGRMTGRVSGQTLASSRSSFSSRRTLAAVCDVRKRCGGTGPNLTEPDLAESESGASPTTIALRASALSVSMCAVVVILVYSGKQWFKYRKRRRRAAQRHTEAYDMSTSVSIASKHGPPSQAPPSMGPSPPSQLQQLHSQTHSSTLVSSPHLHTGTTLVYPMPTAPGAPAIFAAVPSPGIPWYPTVPGPGSIMSPVPPAPPAQAAPPAHGHVYVPGGNSMGPHGPAPVPHAYVPVPSSRPSTPANPPHVDSAASPAASDASVLSPICPALDNAAALQDARRASTASSLFGSVRTTKLPPSPPSKALHLDSARHPYIVELGDDHHSEKSRRSKLLTTAWVREHALPASVASPTTSSGMLVSDTNSPSVPLATSSAALLRAKPPSDVHTATGAALHFGPIATSSPTSASPCTDLPLPSSDPLGVPPGTAHAALSTATAAAESVVSTFPRDPFAARVVHSHEPDMGDEIALVPGDQVWVESVFVDGWGAGTNMTRNVQGVFPLVCIVPEGGDQVGGPSVVPVEQDEAPVAVAKEVSEAEYVPPPTSGLSVSVGGPTYALATSDQDASPHNPVPAKPSSRVSSPRTSKMLVGSSPIVGRPNPLRARLPLAPTRPSPPHSRVSSPTTPTPTDHPTRALLSPQTTPTQASVRPYTAPTPATPPRHAIQASRAAVPRIVTQGLAPAGSGVRRAKSAGELVMAAAIGLTASSATWPPPEGRLHVGCDVEDDENDDDEVATVVLAAGDRDAGEEACLARWQLRQRAMGQRQDGDGQAADGS